MAGLLKDGGNSQWTNKACKKFRHHWRAATHSHSPLTGGAAPGDGGIGHNVGEVGSHLYHVHGNAQGVGNCLGNLRAKHITHTCVRCLWDFLQLPCSASAFIFLKQLFGVTVFAWSTELHSGYAWKVSWMPNSMPITGSQWQCHAGHIFKTGIPMTPHLHEESAQFWHSLDNSGIKHIQSREIIFADDVGLHVLGCRVDILGTIIFIIIDCFYIALVSALEQAHCAHNLCDSEWVTVCILL